MSPRCGNCLRTGKECHFPAESEDGESSSDVEMLENEGYRNIVQDDNVRITRNKDGKVLCPLRIP